MEFEQYYKRIKEILDGVDLSNVTAKQVRKQIEQEQNIVFQNNKKEFDKYIVQICIELQESNDIQPPEPIKKRVKLESNDFIIDDKDALKEVDHLIDEEEEEEEEDDDDDGMESDEFSEVEDVPLRRKRKATAKAKKTKKKTSTRASNMPNCQLSEPLQKIIGTEELPRTQVTKKLWEYIKSKELQDPTDKRYILCDDLLESVFDTKRLFMMSIAKGLKDHLITKPNPNKPKTEDDGDEKVSKKSSKGGFNKLHELSEPLQDLLNEKYVSRPQVVKRLWDYIKENSLQDPTNKRNILNDSKMKSIFKVSKMSMFQMNKLIGDHLSPYDGPIPETSTEGFIVEKSEPTTEGFVMENSENAPNDLNPTKVEN